MYTTVSCLGRPSGGVDCAQHLGRFGTESAQRRPIIGRSPVLRNVPSTLVGAARFRSYLVITPRYAGWTAAVLIQATRKNAPGSTIQRRLLITYSLSAVVKARPESHRLDGDSDGSGARPFAALSNFIFHHLTFTKFLHGGPLNFRVMEEQVVASLPFDESKTSIRNQSLDFTLWHFCTPLKRTWRTAVFTGQWP